MTEYLVTLADGQQFVMAVNLADAAAQISVCFNDPEENANWEVTPYQTADASHDSEEAANLLAEYFAVNAEDSYEVKSINEL